MYRIMVVKSHRDNNKSLYQYLTSALGTPIEFDTLEKLDAKIEKMLNQEGYSKSDFIIVKVIDYTIDAKDYTETETETETE